MRKGNPPAQALLSSLDSVLFTTTVANTGYAHAAPSENPPRGRQPIDRTKLGQRLSTFTARGLNEIHEDDGLRRILDTRNERSGGGGRDSMEEGVRYRLRVRCARSRVDVLMAGSRWLGSKGTAAWAPQTRGRAITWLGVCAST